MRQAIADDKVISSQLAIVSGNLLKYFFGNRHLGSLIFYNHAGTGSVAIKKNRIATA